MNLKLDILVSCMYQKDMSIIEKSAIKGNAVIINQCDCEGYSECQTAFGKAKMYSVKERGLTKSRNMAISKSCGDICLLCDDDEVFEEDYEEKILDVYEKNPQADVVIFNMSNRPHSLGETQKQLKFPEIMKVSSWQISFRKKSLEEKNVRFDELLGAGTGNGAEEELKFLSDCLKNGLKIYYVPKNIASVAQEQSTWFSGFDKRFFENRGATTRYILGFPMAFIYGIYYVIRKRKIYRKDISSFSAMCGILKGMIKNPITKQKKEWINNGKNT